MTNVTRISRGELTASEIVRRLEDEERVIIEATVLGATMELSMRKGGETYYCDTPMRLLTFENADEMRRCLHRFRLAKSNPTADEEPSEIHA